MDQVILNWKTLNDEKFLRFTFQGKLTKELAEQAVLDWNDAFNNESLLEIGLIWNCLEMKSYQPSSAKIWKEALAKHKDRITNIWVVTDNPLIRLGARTMTMISSFNLKAVSTEDEIKSTILV